MGYGLPAVLAVCCFSYLMWRCYPGAVFLWGDAEHRYETILARRRVLWQIVMASVVVEVGSNLFGLALSSYVGR
jgi:hypothetical protein